MKRLSSGLFNAAHSIYNIILYKGTDIKLYTEDGNIIESKAESDIKFLHSELTIEDDVDTMKQHYFYSYKNPYPIFNSKNIIKLQWTSESWSNISHPLIRKTFGSIAAQQFVSVQPMNAPAGLVFFTNFQYGTTTPATEKPQWGNEDVWK